jgi:glycosyltransferase involved in cell wall biosynthesis
MHGKGMTVTYATGFLKLSLYRYIFKNNFVVLYTPLLLKEMKSFIQPEQIFYCMNGIQSTISNVAFLKANTMRAKHRVPKIIFLGHLWTLKGCYVLLEALALLNRKKYLFEAVFIGTEIDITLKDFSNKCVALGIANRVSCLGPLYGKQKTTQLLGADIFAYPTLNDAFGLVLLEAMETGLPIVASEEGSIPEILDDKHTGFIVPKNNPQILANQLAVLLKNKQLRMKMGKAGRERFEARFTYQAFENNLLQVFNQI